MGDYIFMDEDGLPSRPSQNSHPIAANGSLNDTPSKQAVTKGLFTSSVEEDADDGFLGPVAMSFSHLTSDGYLPTMPGDPFSAITPSMWPQDIIQQIHRDEHRRRRRAEHISSTSSTDSAGDGTNRHSQQNAFTFSSSDGVYAKKVDCFGSSTDHPLSQFDVFGFSLDEERNSAVNGEPPISPTGLSFTPFLESAVQRKRWEDYLQFHNSAYSCKICRQNVSFPMTSQSTTATDSEMVALTADKGRFSSQTSICGCRLMRSPQLYELLTKEGGIPHAMRSQVWPRLCGAHEKRLQNASTIGSYADILKSADHEHLATSRQIEKDLLRTLPTHACFASKTSTGVPRLRRVLRCLAWLYPAIGYCQGMGAIVAHLLLFIEEEEVFWMMCCLIEDLLPPSYFSSTLLGVQADQRVLRELISACLPRISQLLREHDIELSLICVQWFLTVFSNVVHVRLLLRIWDLFFYDGSIVLFQITMGILKRKEEELLASENSADMFNCLSNAAQDILDIESLIEISLEISESFNHGMIDSQRRRHLAHLMADEGAIVNPDSTLVNLPNQHVSKRQLKHSKSLLSHLWNASGNGTSTTITSDTMTTSHTSYSFNHSVNSSELMKAKNIRQTEILVDLRATIMKIIKHFLAMDPTLQVASSTVMDMKNGSEPCDVASGAYYSGDEESSRLSHIYVMADYSLESHARDLENYVHVARNRRRRAKALLDFERQDDDELGFRKNDIITVLSTKDEHCWVGELNGLRGWFPAKFVELLDERSKYYSTAGDDTVDETIADLVRGVLCPAIRAIFDHGLRKANLLDSACHPWLFIEEAATKEVEKDFNSVYSRLVLCKTFRLEEDGKVLTPEELLYKAVQAVNLSHDAYHAQMDVKFRSLICCGLNEQVLHLWLETLCSSVDVVKKWYQPWSFIRSPGWVQIKCELRLLAQFGFCLSRDFELPKSKLKDCERQRIRESIRDMLVRQHLFSWELN